MRKHIWTCILFLSVNKKDPLSAKMKPYSLRSKVTSSSLGAGVDNWSHNHRMEITDPLKASAGGVTPSSSSHNSVTSNTHVSVTANPWIRSLRMIATSYNVIVISPTGTSNVCVLGHHLSTRQMMSGQSIMMWPMRCIP